MHLSDARQSRGMATRRRAETARTNAACRSEGGLSPGRATGMGKAGGALHLDGRARRSPALSTGAPARQRAARPGAAMVLVQAAVEQIAFRMMPLFRVRRHGRVGGDPGLAAGDRPRYHPRMGIRDRPV